MLAQLTDLHLLNKRHGSEHGSLRRRLVSYARPLDAEDRMQRFSRALAGAAGAEHLILTGDLTEDGSPAQYEVLAELLAASPFAAEQVTLVPGNHDRYAKGHAFEDALAGPLKGYHWQPGEPRDVGRISIITVDTTFYQHYVFSRGRLPPAWPSISTRVKECLLRGQVVVLAQHHPATRNPSIVMQWFDGNLDHERERAFVQAHPGVYVLHGHAHARFDEGRMFAAAAVVDHDAPLRLYRVAGDQLVSGN